MSLYERNKDFYGQPYLLNEDQMRKPLEVISEFFGNFELYEAREAIMTLMEVAVTSDNDQYSTPKQRDSVVQFCRQIEYLLEASHIVNAQKKQLGIFIE